jgi:hypothetical protein
MEESSFTIEFPEHLPRETWQYILDQLTPDCSSIEQVSGNVFTVSCARIQQMQIVGWALFHTHFKDMCRVIATTGLATAQSSAYSAPTKVRHSK